MLPTALIALVLANAAPTSAGASPYEVRWARDLTVTGVAALGLVVPVMFHDQLVSRSCPCSSADVPAIDRVALGNQSRSAARASDLLLGGAVVLPLAFDALDVKIQDGPWQALLPDALVMAQSVLASSAVNALVKVAVQRPRPYVRDLPGDDARLRDPDGYLSFYSGHASTAFAATLSYASTFAYRHPESAWRPVVFGGAVLTGTSVAVLRVVAGKHFPTDVLTGALVGSASGLIVPWLHRRDGGALVPAVTADSGALFWVATF